MVSAVCVGGTPDLFVKAVSYPAGVRLTVMVHFPGGEFESAGLDIVMGNMISVILLHESIDGKTGSVCKRHGAVRESFQFSGHYVIYT